MKACKLSSYIAGVQLQEDEAGSAAQDELEELIELRKPGSVQTGGIYQGPELGVAIGVENTNEGEKTYQINDNLEL